MAGIKKEDVLSYLENANMLEISELIKDIETLDKSKQFDTTSLGRTNIANLLAVKGLLSK